MKLFFAFIFMAISLASFAETNFFGRSHIVLKNNSTMTVLEDRTSYMGAKGQTLISSDLLVTHQVDFNVDFTNSSGRMPLVRYFFMGFKGRLGEYRLGRHDSPFEIVDDSLKVFFSKQETGLISDPSSRDALLGYIKSFGSSATFLSYNPSNNNNNTIASVMLNHAIGPWYTGISYSKESGQKSGKKLVISYQTPKYGIGFVHKNCPSNIGVTPAEISQGECSRVGGDSVNNLSATYHFGKPYISGQIAKNNKSNIKQATFELGYQLSDSSHVYMELDRLGGNNTSTLGLVTSF